MALRTALFAFAFAVALGAQHRETNPFDSAEDLAEGRRLYRLNCGVCHGMQGRTGRGARLAVRQHRHGNSDAELFRIIQNGIPGTDMPGLWMDEDSTWKILLFVRTLEVEAGEACEATPGDTAQGGEIFARSCLTCHAIGQRGGRLGPELTHIGLTYSREQLREALLEPSKDVGNRYRTVRVETTGGDFVEGVLLNENGYTVHLLDTDENLRSFAREELTSVEKPAESLMPSYAGLLSDDDVDDLLAYLCGLRGGDE